MVKYSIKILKETILEKTLFTSLLIQQKEENFLHGKLRNVKLLVTKELLLVFIHQLIVRLLLILNKNNIFLFKKEIILG